MFKILLSVLLKKSLGKGSKVNIPNFFFTLREKYKLFLRVLDVLSELRQNYLLLKRN
jgi:hypothetical protein